MAYHDLIKKCFIFNGLSEKDIEMVEGIGNLCSYSSRQNIFFEGDPANGFHIVISGKVKIFKLSSEGREQILHIFGPGEPFGEAAVFAGINFPANATALEPTQTFYIDRAKFVALLNKKPHLAMNLLAVLSKRLMIFARMIGDLALKEVPGRLATYLLISSAQKNGASSFDLDLSKTQLASLLGTIPETLSRILSKMQKDKIIEVRGARIKILDFEGLRQISGLFDEELPLEHHH